MLDETDVNIFIDPPKGKEYPLPEVRQTSIHRSCSVTDFLFLAQQMSKFTLKLRPQKGEKTILITILNIALPPLYLALVWLYGMSFFRDHAWAARIKSSFLLAVLATHVIFLLARTVVFGHPPVTAIPEILTMLAISVSATYSVIERRSKAKETGYFILLIAFFFQLISSIFIRDLTVVPEIFKSFWFGLHITNAVLGYASITISATYGLLYLMLYHQIKAHQFGAIYKKLPNLETLERMNFIAISMAFIFLSVAITAGVTWLPTAFPGSSFADPKLIGTASIWLIYGVGIAAKLRGTLRGRSLMLLSIFAFAVAAFSMTIVNLFFSNFHHFD